MTARAITLLDFSNHILVQNSTLIYINAHDTILVTCMHHSTPIQCNFLHDVAIFLYVQKKQLTCQLSMTCYVVWQGLDNRIWKNIVPKFLIFSCNIGMSTTTCHWRSISQHNTTPTFPTKHGDRAGLCNSCTCLDILRMLIFSVLIKECEKNKK